MWHVKRKTALTRWTGKETCWESLHKQWQMVPSHTILISIVTWKNYLDKVDKSAGGTKVHIKQQGTHLWKCGSAGTVMNSGASSMASKNSLSSSSSLASPFPGAAGPSSECGIKTEQRFLYKTTVTGFILSWINIPGFRVQNKWISTTF